MIQVTEARNATRALLSTCCSVERPNVWHQKLVRCAQQVEKALDRVDLFRSYLLRGTAEKLAAITQGMQHALEVVDSSPSRNFCETDDCGGSISTRTISQTECDADLALALRRLWQVYIELALAIKVQEVTTPALNVALPRTRLLNSGGKKPGSPLSKSQNQNDVDFFSCRSSGISGTHSSVVR